jgi:hypothetical protein
MEILNKRRIAEHDHRIEQAKCEHGTHMFKERQRLARLVCKMHIRPLKQHVTQTLFDLGNLKAYLPQGLQADVKPKIEKMAEISKDNKTMIASFVSSCTERATTKRAQNHKAAIQREHKRIEEERIAAMKLKR